MIWFVISCLWFDIDNRIFLDSRNVPISRPYGRAMGCFCNYWWTNGNEMFRVHCVYSRVPLWRGPLYYNILYCSKVTDVDNESGFIFTKYTPYLAIAGELWGVYCENFFLIDRVVTTPPRILYTQSLHGGVPCLCNHSPRPAYVILTHMLAVFFPQ